MIKKLALTITAVCSICIAAAQKKNGQAAATITVKQLTAKADSIAYVDTASNRLVEVYADKNGRFNMQFRQAFPKSVMLWAAPPYRWAFELYVEAGDAITIETNYNDSTFFSGKGGLKQEIIYQNRQRYPDLDSRVDWDKVTPDELFDQYYKVYEQSIALLKANQQKVSPAFYNEQLINLKYRNLEARVMIPVYLKWNSKADRSDRIPARYWGIEKEVELDDKLLSNDTYTKFMCTTYVDFLRRQSFMDRGMRDTIYTGELGMEKSYALIASTYRGKLRSKALSVMFTRSLGSLKDVEAVKPLLDDYIKKYAAPEDMELVLKSYNDYAKTNVGQIPPYFELKGLDGKPVALKDFAGKVVYMDFWASWCAPCRAEMKKGSPVLHEKFKDNKDVVFLYVSIDEKADAWKAAITQDKIEGVHVLSPRGSENEVARAFNITGIPHYILIGRDGKIYDNNAPRPSEQKAYEKISEALKSDS